MKFKPVSAIAAILCGTILLFAASMTACAKEETTTKNNVRTAEFELNPPAEEFRLPGPFVLVLEQVYVEGQGFSAENAPLRTVVGDASVEADLPDPGPQSGLAAEGSGALPQVDEDFLEEVCHLVLVGGEHVADGVDRAAVFPDHHFKFAFCHCLVICFCPLDAGTSEKLQKNSIFFRKKEKLPMREAQSTGGGTRTHTP